MKKAKGPGPPFPGTQQSESHHSHGSFRDELTFLLLAKAGTQST